ncbi:MAG: replicative DNA helicase [Bdellovibrionota bacterium]
MQDAVLSLPHSLEAEKAVLGAILKEQNELTNINANVALTPEHFFLQAHRRIFSVMLELDNSHEPTDLITVANKLRGDEKNESIGPDYLVELMESCPISQNVTYYAQIVRDRYFLRKIVISCQETAKKASNAEGSIGVFVEEVEKAFLEISNQQDSGKGLISGKDALVSTLEELEKRIENDDKLTGVTSGFLDLDAITGGWQQSDLIILAARPAMGKTALGLNWLLNAVKAGKTAVIFTLEMSKEQLLERLLSAEGRVDSSRMRKGDLQEDEQNRLMHAARAIHQFSHRLAIDETPAITLSELRSRCRRYQKEHGLDLVIIDYLQLMGSNSRGDSREREVSEISAGLKGLAKELSVPIIALAQLNRGADARTDKRPKISDLRESGSIEQDADLILFVYRDEYYNPNSEATGKSEIIIGKNRHGQTDTVYLAFLPNFVSFHNLIKEV